MYYIFYHLFLLWCDLNEYKMSFDIAGVKEGSMLYTRNVNICLFKYINLP